MGQDMLTRAIISRDSPCSAAIHNWCHFSKHLMYTLALDQLVLTHCIYSGKIQSVSFGDGVPPLAQRALMVASRHLGVVKRGKDLWNGASGALDGHALNLLTLSQRLTYHVYGS